MATKISQEKVLATQAIVSQALALATETIPGIPLVVGPPTATLNEVGLTADDFNTLVVKSRTGEAMSKELDKKVRKALALVDPPVLPEHPDDWFPQLSGPDEPEKLASNKLEPRGDAWVLGSGAGKTWLAKNSLAWDAEADVPPDLAESLSQMRRSGNWAEHDSVYNKYLQAEGPKHSHQIALVHTPEQAAALGRRAVILDPSWQHRARDTSRATAEQRNSWTKMLVTASTKNNSNEEDSDQSYSPDSAELEHLLVGKSYAELVELVLSTDDDRIWSLVYPYRVKGEKPLRRLRLSDLPRLYSDKERLRSNLLLLENCRRYIFVLNMCLADLVCQAFRFIRWYHLRGALASVSTFLVNAKEVTILLKATIYTDAYLMLVETTGLAGYRLLPDPDFDLTAATEAAATGFGLDHTTSDGLSKPFGWLDCLPVLKVGARHEYLDGRKVLTFEEFVSDSSKWATSGSSSEGRLKFSVDGEWQSTKARKLMLKYITTPTELLSICQRPGVVRAVSLVKSELAKIRIAVASELRFYLVWAYLHYLYGDLYTAWPGVTLNESPSAEMDRLHEMVETSVDTFGYPADFQQFDAQPSTLEIVCIGATLLRAASTVKEIPSWLSSLALTGLALSTLSTPKTTSGIQKTFFVKDYLPSGIAITSAVGNAFNCVASESMIRLVCAWTGQSRDVWLRYLALRGDDSSFQVYRVAFTYLLALAAKALNYKHAAFKVAILPHGSELLRVSISSSYGCRGYPARLIPTLSQRKPWSNEPWDPEGVVRSHWDTCCALVRRRQSGVDLWHKLAELWSTKRLLSSRVLTTHPLDGGLGLGLPIGIESWINPSLPSNNIVGVSVASGAWASSLLSGDAARLGLAVSQSTVAALVQEDAISSLGTVDLPEIAKVAQKRYKLGLSEIVVHERKLNAIPAGFQNKLDVICTMLRSCVSPECLRNVVASSVPTAFGRYHYLGEKVLLHRRAVRYQPGLELTVEVGFDSDSAALSRRFRCPRTVAEDWLLGMAPAFNFGYVHPNTKDPLSRLCCAMIEQSDTTRLVFSLGLGVACRVVSWQLGNALFESKLHQNLYSW